MRFQDSAATFLQMSSSSDKMQKGILALLGFNIFSIPDNGRAGLCFFPISGSSLEGFPARWQKVNMNSSVLRYLVMKCLGQSYIALIFMYHPFLKLIKLANGKILKYKAYIILFLIRLNSDPWCFVLWSWFPEIACTTSVACTTWCLYN